MLYPSVNIDNTQGYQCYGCGTTVNGVDLFVLSGLSYPNDYLCSNCLVARLRDGTLSLTQGSGASGECDSCECEISAGENTYCESCYGNQYDNGMENALSSCDDCGDDSSVYCRSCAPLQFDLVDLNDYACNQCNGPLDLDTVFCASCRNTSGPVDAQAADGIEVNWGD